MDRLTPVGLFVVLVSGLGCRSEPVDTAAAPTAAGEPLATAGAFAVTDDVADTDRELADEAPMDDSQAEGSQVVTEDDDDENELDKQHLLEVQRQLDEGADPTSLLFETVIDDSVTIETGLAVAHLLLRAGADTDGVRDDRSLLHVVADAGCFEMVDFVVASGADINAANPAGMTPIFAALRNVERVKIVELFLNQGANVNAVSSDGKTPLIEAVARGRIDVARLLLRKGADVNALDGRGNNALVPAIRGRPKRFEYDDPSEDIQEMVGILIAAGCDPHHRNQDGQSAIDLAREAEMPDILDLFARQEGAVTAPASMQLDLDPYPLQLRVWKTSDGRFTTTARMLDCKEDVVFLENEMGEQLRPPKSKLSAADQEYVATALAFAAIVQKLKTDIESGQISADFAAEDLQAMVDAARKALDNDDSGAARDALNQLRRKIGS